MQQIENREKCILYFGKIPEEVLDKLDPKTILPPGDTCMRCSIRTGDIGIDGSGVLRLPSTLKLNEETRLIEPISVVAGQEVQGCRYNCRVPKTVTVKPAV